MNGAQIEVACAVIGAIGVITGAIYGLIRDARKRIKADNDERHDDEKTARDEGYLAGRAARDDEVRNLTDQRDEARRERDVFRRDRDSIRERYDNLLGHGHGRQGG